MKLDEKHISVIFKALCDENRIRILKYLMNGEKCACKLLDDLNIAQSKLSIAEAWFSIYAFKN